MLVMDVMHMHMLVFVPQPLIDAIQVAPVSDTLRVRLLSMPQAKQAPSTASAGQRPTNRAWPGHDGRHAQRDAAVDILLEGEPSQQRGEHPFGVEQQRSTGRRHAGQAQHQEHRADDAAGSDRAGKPQQPIARQRHGRCADDPTVERETDSGTEIEQAGQQPRVDRVQ